MIKNKQYHNHDEYDDDKYNTNMCMNNNNNNNNSCGDNNSSNQFISNNNNISSNKMNPHLFNYNNIDNNNTNNSQKNNNISTPTQPHTTTSNKQNNILPLHNNTHLTDSNNNNSQNNNGSIFKYNENNNNNNNIHDINTKFEKFNNNIINCNINNCNSNFNITKNNKNNNNSTNNKKNIIIGSSYNLKINNSNNNNNNNNNIQNINITNNNNNNNNLNIINSNNNSTTSSSYNSDNYLSYNCSDSGSCSSSSDNNSDNNSCNSDNNSDNIKNNSKLFINNSCRNSLIYTNKINNQNQINNNNNKMTETLNIESLNNYFVNYFQDSLDIELVKIHLNSGYFIAGSNCSGSLEIILNNDIKTAGLNLKWKSFEHVIVCPNSKLSNNNGNNNNSLSKDPTFEIIEASSMLSAYSLKENQSNGGGGSSLKSSTSSFLSKSGTVKKNSKVFNTLKSSVNTLKNSGSIHSFLKISSSSSSFNLQNHYGIQNNEKCQQKRIIYKSVENIFNTDDSDGIMSAGTHIIPFSFPIPSHLPSSFCDYSIDKETGEKIISAVLYRLSVSFVESVQQFKLKKSFSVCEPSIVSASVNEIPLKSEKKKSFIGSSGFIHLKVFLKRNVFFPSEKIPIQIKVENSTSKSIEYIQISIKKIQTLLLNKNDFLNSASVNNGGSDNIDDKEIINDFDNFDENNNYSDKNGASVAGGEKEGKKICKKNSIKTLQKYAGVGSHSNYNEIISFNTDEIKPCNQTTNGSLINCKYQLIVQCVIKRTLHSVRIKLPILFGNLPSNDAITSIFEDEYKLYLLNI